jgi:amidase
LIALRGSILGVGTDVGGSIRIPALCCGTFGFKPTASRVPFAGQQPVARPGNPGIQSCAGPLATSHRDLVYFIETVLSAKPWNYDSTALAIPWRQTPRKSQLRIGVYEDPDFPLHPPVRRSLTTAVKLLEGAGHIIVPLPQFPSLAEGIKLCIQLFSLDNTRTSIKHIMASGEPFVPSVAAVLGGMTSPPKDVKLEEFFDLNVAWQVYKEKWNKIWVANELDVLVGPGAETTAVPHDTYGFAPYTMIWNLLNVNLPFLFCELD